MLIYYITSYETKGDCSQSQQIIAITIIKKIYNNEKNQLGPWLDIYISLLDKFMIKLYN